MSGKRRADNQVTRENLHEFENEDNDEAPSGPSRATADVLATRKILKPRSRLNRAGAAAAANGNGSSAPSSGFSFGASANVDENKPANPFGGFGGFGKTNATTSPSKPAFTFGQPKPTEDSDKPKTNLFQFLGKPQESSQPTKEEVEKPKSNVFSFLGNNNNSNTSLTKTSSTDLVSAKQTDKPNKIRALNDNFYDKITEQRKSDPVSNFTPILRKYIDYYDKIENDLDFLPDADNDTQEELKEQKALPAPTFTFGGASNSSFNAPAAAAAPSFSITSKPVEKKEEVREEKEPTPMDESKDDTQNNNQDSDDSDSDDEIKVEGPKFTLAKPPTTTDSVFKLDATTTSSAPHNTSGPSFTFTADTSKKFDNPFKLPAAEKKEEEQKPKESPVVNEVKSSSSNNFSWSPGKPINFNGGDESNKKDESTSKPAFSFGETTKPAFSFGQSTSTEKTEPVAQSKPTFNFGGSSSVSSEKSSFNFGASANGSENKDAASKPSFNFGATSSNSKPAFNFGGSSSSTTESLEKPKFEFGGSTKPAFSFGTGSSTASSSFNFSFNKAPESKTESSTQNNGDGDDDKVQEVEVEGNFKPVVQLTEKIEDKTGEEDEETLYTKRSKLMLYNKDNKEQPYESKGLGELKVLQNKETKKSRVLVRSDGANRVLLNAAVTKEFTYGTIGKGDTVRIPVITSEAKFETYFARVKTPEDGANLLKALQDAQQQ